MGIEQCPTNHPYTPLKNWKNRWIVTEKCEHPTLPDLPFHLSSGKEIKESTLASQLCNKWVVVRLHFFRKQFPHQLVCYRTPVCSRRILGQAQFMWDTNRGILTSLCILTETILKLYQTLHIIGEAQAHANSQKKIFVVTNLLIEEASKEPKSFLDTILKPLL